MRIEKLILKNYRQFKDVEIPFEKSDNDLHVIIGVMGTGKTNILNAINWCLYGDEPHLSKDSQQLPILNLKSIEEAEDGEDKKIIVEVWTKTDEDHYIIFTRKAVYRVYKNDIQPKLQDTVFEVKITDDKGNMKILSDEDANSCVERFVPKEIREFFFFDGERLDRYFKEATGDNIRHAIFNISQIDLVERVENKLNKILKDLTKEAGKLSPKIDEIRKKLEDKNKDLKDIEHQIEECKRQITIAKNNIKDYEDKLRNIPDIEALEKEREKLKEIKQKKKALREEKIKDRQELLFEYGKIIMLLPAIKKTIQIIEEKKDKKEIPPTYDKGLLEKILQSGTCDICGRYLDDEAEKRVKELLKEIKLSSDIAQRLLSMENILRQYESKIKRFDYETKKISQEINIIENDLSDLEQKINKIDSEIGGYNVNKIKEWHKELKKYEIDYDRNQQKLGILEGNKKSILKEIQELDKQLKEELKKDKKVKILEKQIEFCSKSLGVLRKTKEDIMNESRQKIENRTKDLFFNLHWKKSTFKDVKIDKNYNIDLIHSTGIECLGTISGGEREVLTLAFTMALHEVSGFDSPIIVDRPLAMVSGDPRKNIVDVFSKISTKKQTILLFTPDDYSSDISGILDFKASNKFKLLMLPDEKEIKIEVL